MWNLEDSLRCSSSDAAHLWRPCLSQLTDYSSLIWSASKHRGSPVSASLVMEMPPPVPWPHLALILVFLDSLSILSFFFTCTYMVHTLCTHSTWCIHVRVNITPWKSFLFSLSLTLHVLTKAKAKSRVGGSEASLFVHLPVKTLKGRDQSFLGEWTSMDLNPLWLFQLFSHI